MFPSTRRKVLVGLAAVSSAFGLMASPASAASTTYGMEVLDGSIAIFSAPPANSLIETFGLGASSGSASCTSTDSLTIDDTAMTFSASINGTTDDGSEIIETSMALSGTLSGPNTTPPGYDIASAGPNTATAKFYARTGACTKGALQCTITATNLSFTGYLHTSSPLSALSSSDYAELTGSNPAFFLGASGPGCGTRSAANNGHAEFEALIGID